jgi:protein-L-isoaspartate(D-aspartate) O-methyltransferase
LLDAVRAVPRAAFVPPDRVDEAYRDVPLPIPHGQVTTQPSLVARMVEAARVAASDRVLEVGAGYGSQTALLERLAARVWSVERWAEIAEAGRANLAAAGVENVELAVGGGSAGVPEHAPYDVVLVSAAFPSVPARWPLRSRSGDGSCSRSARAEPRTWSCSSVAPAAWSAARSSHARGS